MACGRPDLPARARRGHCGALVRGVAVALALAAAGPLSASTYKWVDDKGVVHYSDQMPPEAVNKGSTQLSPQGVPIRKIDPAPAPDTLKAREAEQDRQKELARQQLESARRDRALLNSYSSEAEIDLARARAMQTVEEALQSALAYTSELSKRRAALFERKGTFAKSTLPPDIDQEIQSIQSELAHQAEVVAQKRRQLAEIKAKYDADKARWLVLAGAAAASGAAVPKASSAAGGAPTPAPAAPPAGARPTPPK